MKYGIRIVGIAMLMVAMSGAAWAQGTLRATIEEKGKQFLAELKQGNAAAIAKMYTSDAKAFPPNGEIVQGREAIQKLWQDAIDGGMRDASFTVLEVERKGDIAYEVGLYAVRGSDGKEVDKGKYLVIWKREAGSWRLHRDIWNTSMPMPTPAK
ncbi:MAG: DUF4440 domain-containing protein [Terriglobales bacterium]